MKRINRELFNTNNYKESAYLEDYKYICGINDIAFKEKDFREYQNDILNDDLSHLLNKLEKLYQERYFLITGTLGLWNGKHKIVPIKINGLSKAIRRCLNSNDTLDFSIKQINGTILVEKNHHDGTNIFVIYMLNEKGERSKNGNLTKPYYHKAIEEIIF